MPVFVGFEFGYCLYGFGVSLFGFLVVSVLLSCNALRCLLLIAWFCLGVYWYFRVDLLLVCYLLVLPFVLFVCALFACYA